VLGAVVNDQELPLEFTDRVRHAVASVDLSALYKTEKGLAILAATFVSQQAGRFGTEVVAHVRAELIALASEVATAWPTSPDDHAIQVLLSYPIYLYSQADTERGTRFTHVASLLEEMVNRLPAMLDKAQYLVDRLIEGLPNHHSRALWRLQVKLRALR
jgi:hypothetical protein